MSHPVKFNLPTNEWVALLRVAEANNVTIGDLVVSALRDIMRPVVVHGQSERARIEFLVRAGLPDAKIAAELSVTNARVGRARRAIGLPANRMRRTG